MPPYVPPPPARTSAAPVVIAVLALLVGGAVGVVIGRGSPKQAIAEAEAPTGTLDVTSEPEGGMVVIDGRLSGVTPVEALMLDPGRHVVVIDVFGYQPYAGVLDIEASGAARLEAVLAPIGGEAATTGRWSGTASATTVPVPASALHAPPAAAATPAPAAPTKTRRRAARSSAPARDCYGEHTACENSCRDAARDCEFSCPYCSSCNTSMGWEECNRQCAACKQGCKSTGTFCESQCDSALSRCR